MADITIPAMLGSAKTWRGRVVDETLRQELQKAREALLAQIDQLEWRYPDWSPLSADYRSAYADLQKQVREIDDILSDETGGITPKG